MSLTITAMRRITYGMIGASFLVLVLLIARHVTSGIGDVAEAAALVSICSGIFTLYCFRSRR